MSTETNTLYKGEIAIPDNWDAFHKANAIITPDSLHAFGFEGYSSFKKHETIPHVWVRSGAPSTFDETFAVFLSGPSSVGKDAVMQGVKQVDPYLICPVVTCTDRAIRKDKNEIDGVDYHFLTKEEFDRRIEENYFIEWSKIYGKEGKEHRSGIPKNALEYARSCGQLLIFRITFNGIQTARKNIENELSMPTISVGLLPETTLSEYKKNLTIRRKGEDILSRFENAKHEMEQMGALKFQTDYIIGNPPDPSGRPNEAIIAFDTLLQTLFGKSRE